MTKRKLLIQDPVTQKYYYNGKWYKSYPLKEIGDDPFDEYWNWEIDRKRDQERKYGI